MLYFKVIMLEIIQLPPSRFNELDITLNPETSVVVVAQDVDSKAIKGYWVGCAVIHIEPVSLDPSIRDGGITGIKMLQTLLSILATKGDPTYYAFADRPEIEGYLQRLGLTKLDYSIWYGINPLCASVHANGDGKG